MNNYEVVDIEREILGAILLKNELIGIALSHDINEKMFNHEKHKSVYKMMRLLSNNGNAITVALMGENYPNEFKKVGISYLVGLAGGWETVTVFENNIKQLIKKYQKTTLLTLAKNTLSDKDADTEKLIANIYQELLNVTKLGNKKRKDRTDRLMEYTNSLWKQHYGEVDLKIKTGYERLDKQLGGGLDKSNFVTVVARSGIGKTTFALNMAYRMAKSGLNVAFYTIEMNEAELYNKIVALENKTRYNLVQQPEKLSTEEVRLAETTMNNFSDMPFEVYDDLGTSEELINSIMFNSMGGDIDVVFVDYLQLFCETSQGNNLSEKLGNLTITLKKIAQMNKIVVIALAQANRQADHNSDLFLKRVDIQDSARIEQNSNIVMGLVRDIKLDDEVVRKDPTTKIDYNSFYMNENPELMYCQIMKNRAGAIGKVPMRYQGKFSLIDDWVRS